MCVVINPLCLNLKHFTFDNDLRLSYHISYFFRSTYKNIVDFLNKTLLHSRLFYKKLVKFIRKQGTNQYPVMYNYLLLGRIWQKEINILRNWGPRLCFGPSRMCLRPKVDNSYNALAFLEALDCASHLSLCSFIVSTLICCMCSPPLI